ncbi:transposase [Glycomyces xiaoerkulensis]|uniref:transposase n=1 Tax=Glycomyces xiaoerkulensis TaxID=2038139 RepID=UPI000C26C11A|nr:transposase [Glycomyces xiaoerkulensis]
MSKKHSDEFKSSAVKRYLNTNGATYRQVAAELGIRPAAKLRRWVVEYGQGLFQTPPGGPGSRCRASHIGRPAPEPAPGGPPIAAPANRPLQVGTPPPPARAGRDRPADAELASALHGGGTAVLCPKPVGAAGVGKTQAAAAYARRRWERRELDLLVWVDATTRANVTAAFAEAADELLHPSEGGNEEKATRLLSWLALPGSRRWLIVIDDLADPADLVGLWPPDTANGRTIVTTRHPDAAPNGTGRHRVEVGGFTAAEAAGYLAERLGHRPRQLEGAAALAESLGHLPLALSQAAAYLLDQPGLSCETYRRRFEDRARRRAEGAEGHPSGGHERTVAETWSLATESADRRSPQGAALAILRLAGVLDPSGIPLELLTSATVLEHLALETSAGRRRRSHALTPAVVERTLGVMHRLSLLDFDGARIRVHPMVQRAVVDRFDRSRRRLLPRVAADAVAEVWPRSETGPAPSAALRSNLDHLQRDASEALFTPAIHPVLFRAGYSLGSHGQVTMAAGHFGRLYETAAFLLGPDHPDTLEACYDQAVWRAAAGDAERAVEAFGTVLDGRLRALGPDHPDTRAARDGLRFWQSETGTAEASSGLRLSYIGARTRAPSPSGSGLARGPVVGQTGSKQRR